MRITSTYPVLMTTDVASTTAFYRALFPFEVTFEADWYISLKLDTWELAVLDARHETVPAEFRGRAASGLLLNFEVEDVDAQYERIVTRGGTPAVLPIRSEEFGQRHFIIAAPDGVLIDVITPIEPSGAFADPSN